MNIAIKLFAILHAVSVSIICLNGLSLFQNNDDKTLNKFGVKVLNIMDLDIGDTRFFKTLKIYGHSTGTARGYSFFSPNVLPLERSFYFLSEGDKLISPKTKHFETSFKYNSFKRFLFQNIFSDENRDGYLRSLGAHLMVNNSAECIDVYFTNKFYNDINESKANSIVGNEEDILLFTLRKKK